MAKISEDTIEFSQKDFRKSYEEYGENNLVKQVPHLARLADVYLKRARENKGQEHNWLNYVKAHALVNSCLARDSREQHWHKKIFSIEKEFYGGELSLTEDEHLNKIRSLKQKLVNLRSEIRDKLKPVTAKFDKLDLHNESSEENISQMKMIADQMFELSGKCSDEMLQIAAVLIQESEKIVSSDPPPPYCAVALGSLARGEATPYSDLEYLFLVPNSDHEEYFKKLAIDTYFRMNNFRETPLKCMYLEEVHDNYQSKGEKRWFLESAVINGFKIDGFTPRAGNIPTGNALDSGCKFIKTPQQLADMYSKSLHSRVDPNLPGDLSHLLSDTIKVHSQHGGDEFLGKLQSKLRSIDICDDRQEITKRRITTLREDLQRYGYVPQFQLHLFHPKQDAKIHIFRFPTLLIGNLSVVQRINASKPWEALDEMLYKGNLSLEYYQDLSFFLASALYIRMSAYLKHDSQKEDISFLPGSSRMTTDMYHLSQQVAIPVTMCIMRVKKPASTSVAQLMQRAEGWAAWGEEEYSLKVIQEGLDILNVEQTMEILKEASTSDSELVRYILLIRNALHHGDVYEISLQYAKIMQGYVHDSSTIAATEIEICSCLIHLKRWDQVEIIISESYEKLLNMAEAQGISTWEANSEKEKLDLVMRAIVQSVTLSHDGEGNVNEIKIALFHQWFAVCMQRARKFQKTNQPLLAIEYYQLIMQHFQFENFQVDRSSHIFILTNLADNFTQAYQFQKAEECFKKAIDTFTLFYGKNYRDKRKSKLDIGLAFVKRRLGKYESAGETLEDYRNTDHAEDKEAERQLPLIYYNMALLSCDQGLNHQSIAQFKKSLELTNADDVNLQARNHYQLGRCYLNLDNYKAAAYETNLSLKLLQSIQHREHDQRDIAAAMHQLGTVFLQSDQIGEAEKLLKQSLGITIDIYGEDHHAVATSYQCLAAVYFHRGEYEEAEDLLKKSAYITVQTFGDRSCDPELAKTYLMLGQIKAEVNDTKKAYAEMLRAVTMLNCRFGHNSQHPFLLFMSRELLQLSKKIELCRQSKLWHH